MSSERRRHLTLGAALVALAGGVASAQPAPAGAPPAPAPPADVPPTDVQPADVPPADAPPADVAPPAPTPPTPTPPTPPAPAPPTRPRLPVTLTPGARAPFIGVEVGLVATADPRSTYGGGPGKTIVLGARGWEVRVYERYELEDRTGTYRDARGVRGRFAITSVGRRYTWPLGPVTARALVGLAYVSRPSLRVDYDEISSDYELRPQRGLAVLGGIGVALGPLVVEARAYPTYWASIANGNRLTFVDGMAGTEELTDDTSPGGIPVTLTAGISLGW